MVDSLLEQLTKVSLQSPGMQQSTLPSAFPWDFLPDPHHPTYSDTETPFCLSEEESSQNVNFDFIPRVEQFGFDQDHHGLFQDLLSPAIGHLMEDDYIRVENLSGQGSLEQQVKLE
jgi:hypothetical protein